MVVLHLTNFTLLIICMCLQSIYYPTNALRHTIHMTHINSCISVGLIQLFTLILHLQTAPACSAFANSTSFLSRFCLQPIYYPTNALRDTTRVTCHLSYSTQCLCWTIGHYCFHFIDFILFYLSL